MAADEPHAAEAGSTAPPGRSGQLRVGVDIGGTFTDLSVSGPDGILAVGKTLTTPDEPARAVEDVIDGALDRLSIDAADLDQIIHATTLVTNAILERRGAPTALLTTDGFRDTLGLATEKRYDLYDLDLELPVPLVPRWLCFDVPERTLADGSVAVPLDVEHVGRLARELEAAGVTAVAVCFLHSFANPEHELAAKRAIEKAAPALRVALSSEVSPQIREYERATTATASVYVQEVVERYLGDLERRLEAIGYGRELLLMLSHGGVATVDTAKRHPVRLLESGPAAGALAAAAFGASAEEPDLVSFDMGGTTAKLCLVEGGSPLKAQSFEVDRKDRLHRGSGLPLRLSTIDMVEIGVGGGSIARVDALGLLKAGPRSAGASPGPACYGRGGELPTVTDADLVLGYLDPGYFLGGTMTLDVEAARAAISAQVAEPLGLSLEAAALGIHQVVNESMANAARVHAVERGKDPTRLPLFAFGGAGAIHATGVARRLGSSLVIVPPFAGVMSTIGLLSAPLAFDFVRSRRAGLEDLGQAEVEELFGAMEAEGEALLGAAGVTTAEIEHQRSIDARLVGQGYEINVAMDGLTGWPKAARTAFEAAYRDLFGRSGPPVEIEVLRWRVVSSAPRPELTLLPRLDAGEEPGAEGSRLAALGPDLAMVEAAVHDRYGLSPGERLEGPAIVQERESTTLVPHGASCRVAEDRALVIDLDGASG